MSDAEEGSKKKRTE